MNDTIAQTAKRVIAAEESKRMQAIDLNDESAETPAAVAR